MQGNLLDKIIVKEGLEAEKAWTVARDTMRGEFRVARKQDETMREVLKDPGFKEAFVGEDVETPGLDVLSSLTEQAVEETGKFLLNAEKYEQFTGPSIRAAVFVRDAAYTALLSYFSTQHVLQQNDLAGNLARSAGVLQLKYKKSVDALADCRNAGF
jgi:hypothetical protein